MCKAEGSTVVSFEFDLRTMVPLAASMKFPNDPARCEYSEAYRVSIETFRKQNLEGFRGALERLRQKAEELRRSLDPTLYAQIISTYSNLFEKYYKPGIDSYNDAIKRYQDCPRPYSRIIQ